MSECLTHVLKRTGAVVPFNRDRITNAIYRAAVAVGGRDRAIAESLTDEVDGDPGAQLCRGPHPHRRRDPGHRGEGADRERARAHGQGLHPLPQERAIRRERREEGESQRDPENIPYRKLWEVLNWAVDHNVHNVFRLNERIARGEFADIVRESDIAYEKDIDDAARLILNRRDEVRVAIIAGPSSSGQDDDHDQDRRTARARGVSLVALNVDNYFYNLEMHPKDEFGDYDFETPQALDLALINEHLQRLIAGEEVCSPTTTSRRGSAKAAARR